MKFTYFLFILILSFRLSAQNPVVQVREGKIEGTTNVKGDIHVFKGIPFAAPPVGDLRWKTPQPVRPWEGIRSCKDFSASPMQGEPRPFLCWSKEFLIPDAPIDEDCLYLNVWSPKTAGSDKKPVLVYIYGGGFRSGGSACPIYDGEAMASKGIVFVSLNYRVGVFGFLAHPELSKEAAYGSSGNYALLDMIAALQWVKQNIETFGGDPKNVTIAGQSAGAFGVNYLVASPLTKGLFQKAIAQSGGNLVSSPLRPALTKSGAEQLGVTFAEKLGCSNLAELRAKPAVDILQAQGGLSGPIIDGYFLPESVGDIFRKGKQNDIPTIVGWNDDDKVMFQAQAPEVFREQAEKRFGTLTAAFFDAYPAGTPEQSQQAQFDAGRDETFAIQDYTWAKVQQRTGKHKIYVYNFNRKLPAHTPETQFGAFHSGEIVYAYDNLHTLDRPWEPIDQQLADRMSDYWANFVKTGNPNGKGLPKWKPYHPKKEPVMILDVNSGQQPLPTKRQLAFWEQYFGLNP